jgi:hypothetical protein
LIAAPLHLGRAHRHWTVRATAGLTCLASFALSACSMLTRVPTVPAIVQLEVWNRTLDDVFLVDDQGSLISVPACGHAESAPLSVTKVELRMDAGLITTFGSSGTADPQYLVVVAAAREAFPSTRRPVALPACAGHPTVVP